MFLTFDRQVRGNGDYCSVCDPEKNPNDWTNSCAATAATGTGNPAGTSSAAGTSSSAGTSAGTSSSAGTTSAGGSGASTGATGAVTVPTSISQLLSDFSNVE